MKLQMKIRNIQTILTHKKVEGNMVETSDKNGRIWIVYNFIFICTIGLKFWIKSDFWDKCVFLSAALLIEIYHVSPANKSIPLCVHLMFVFNRCSCRSVGQFIFFGGDILTCNA